MGTAGNAIELWKSRPKQTNEREQQSNSCCNGLQAANINKEEVKGLRRDVNADVSGGFHYHPDAIHCRFALRNGPLPPTNTL